MISYAQHLEDETLMRALGEVQNGFYIDVGASHPSEGNVTKVFYDLGWCGINIEPAESTYRLLSEQRPRDINIRVCAGAKDGFDEFDFYPHLNDGVNPISDHLRTLQGATVTAILPVISLDTVIAEHSWGRTIHFLKIDVEGYERQVLEGINLAAHRPWIIVVEATLPHTRIRSDHQWNDILFSAGYQEAYFDGLNCFYVSPDQLELKSVLPR
jgi:FkbM family methyltransferase